MPALNGIELLKTIRQTQPSSNETMPVIALTARQDLTESDFKEKGFATCLYKPFNINDLAIALNKAINIPFSKKKDPDVHPHVDNNKKDVIQLQSLTAFAGNDEKSFQRNTLYIFGRKHPSSEPATRSYKTKR